MGTTSTAATRVGCAWTLRDGLARALLFTLFVFAILPGIVSNASAQTFYVRGVVHLDRESGAPASAATVLIPGTLFGGITNDAGGFELGPLPGGEYTVVVRYTGYKDLSTAIQLETSDLDLNLVVRRADVDLNSSIDAESAKDIFELSAFNEPGTLAALVRQHRPEQISQAGWSSGIVQPGAVRGPLAIGRIQFDARQLPSLILFPVSRRIAGTAVLPRMYSEKDAKLPVVIAIEPDEHVLVRTGQLRPTVVLDVGAHSNGRLVQAGLQVHGVQGRMQYQIAGSATRAGDYETGSGEAQESSLKRVAADASIALRLTPFSDLLARYNGSSDGETALPSNLFRQERASDHTAEVRYRLSKPESAVNQVTAGVSAIRAYERVSRPTTGTGFTFSTIQTTALGIDASASHQIGASGSGVFRARFESMSQRPDNPPGSTLFKPWDTTEFGIYYGASKRLQLSTINVNGSIREHRVMSDLETRLFHLVSGRITLEQSVRSSLIVRVSISSDTEPPRPLFAFNSATPAVQFGQTFGSVAGQLSLKAPRYNSLAIRVSTRRSSRSASLSASLIDLQRYYTLDRPSLSSRVIESSGTAVSLSAAVVLSKPPFAATRLSANWTYGVDRRTKSRIVGTHSPTARWSARLQAPGGSVFFEPVVNGIVGLPAADSLWEVDSKSAVWIDLTAGVSRGRAEFLFGVTNLNDATWRSHTALSLSVNDRPVFEPGRSFFFRYRRRV